jgi:uncharacterized protein with ACT and thioredoxin-like domain
MIELVGSKKRILGAIDAESVIIVYCVECDDLDRRKPNIYRDINGIEYNDCPKKIEGLIVYELRYDERAEKIYLIERRVTPVGGAL